MAQKTNSKPRVKKKNIMFVCTGNTCRSAMAQYIMQHELKKRGLNAKYSVSSSGVMAYEGEDMPPSAKQALKILGIPFKKHSSKLTTPALIKKAYLIIAATNRHKEIVNSPKCRTLGSFIENKDLTDPYGGMTELYLKTAECILYAAQEIIDYVESMEKQEQEGK